MLLSTSICGYLHSGLLGLLLQPGLTQRARRRNFLAERLRLHQPHEDPAPGGFLSSFEGSGKQAASRVVDLLTCPESALGAA